MEVMISRQKVKSKSQNPKTASVKLFLSPVSNHYAISKVFSLPKMTAIWTRFRNNNTRSTKLCEAARRQTVGRRSNLTSVQTTLLREKFTLGFSSFCKSARQSKGTDLSGPFQMVSCCMRTTCIVGCVQLKLLGNLTQTAIIWNPKPRSTKPCVLSWLTGWSTCTKNGSFSLRRFS